VDHGPGWRGARRQRGPGARNRLWLVGAIDLGTGVLAPHWRGARDPPLELRPGAGAAFTVSSSRSLQRQGEWSAEPLTSAEPSRWVDHAGLEERGEVGGWQSDWQFRDGAPPLHSPSGRMDRGRTTPQCKRNHVQR